MFDQIRNLLHARLGDSQGSRIVGLIAAAVALPLVLLVVILTYWLMTGLWSVTRDSPLGAWGFVGAIAAALAASALVGLWAARLGTRPPPPVDSGGAQLKKWREELDSDTSTVRPEERERWEQARAVTPDTLKGKLREAMRQAEIRRDAASFAAVEQLMTQLLAADPGAADLVAGERLVLDRLRQSA
jgi:hypothetical protein